MAKFLTLKLDDADFQRMLRSLSDRDMRIAATWALNDAAAEAFGNPRRPEKIAAHIRDVFDRPTPFAQNAFYVRGARPADLAVTVEEKTAPGGRHFMKVEETGGVRPQTGLEQRLSLAANGVAHAVIPADGARLDAYGNWAGAERNQVMSALQVQRDVGVTSNQTETSKARGKRRGRASFFVPRNGGLSPGIYKRDARGNLSIVAVFTRSAPKYEPRLQFFETVEQDFARVLPDHLSRAIAKMVGRRATGR